MTDEAPGAPGPLTGRLGFRLVLLLALALLPLSVISAVQSRYLINESRIRSESALMGATLHAAGREIALIQRGQGVAEALAANSVTFLRDPDACSLTMKSVIEQSGGAFTLAGFIQPDGIMRCSSAGRTVDYSDSERFQSLKDDPKRVMRVIASPTISKQPVLSITQPTFDGIALTGFIVLSIPQAALGIDSNRASTPWGARPLSLMTFDTEGALMTASEGLDGVEPLLPMGRTFASLASDEPLAFTSIAQDGIERTFSIVPVIPRYLYAIGTWPEADIRIAGDFGVAGPFLWPAMMCLASVIIAWMASEKLVTSYVRTLRRSITAFARGDRMAVQLNFARAPSEIREVADSYQWMTDSIIRNEAELEDVIHQKEVLLREVHHRVKNNLQLISSMMNMQLRLARSPETKDIVRTLQERVMSLATIHRGLYQTSGLTDIRADELLPDILGPLVKLGSGPGRRFAVDAAFADIRLTPDQAVPLALFLTEAVTNAVKYGGAGSDGPTQLVVRFERRGGSTAEISVANSLDPASAAAAAAPDADTRGLGTQLMNAFAQQLGGPVEATQDAGWYRLGVRFDVHPLVRAEARHGDVEALTA